MKKMKFVVEADLRQEKANAENSHQDLMDVNKVKVCVFSCTAHVSMNTWRKDA